MRFNQALATRTRRATSLLALLSALLLGSVSLASAQEVPLFESTYRVGAQSGEMPYFPTVGTQRFSYTVEHYCEYCVIVVGGLRMPGKYTPSREFPLGKNCEATLYFPSGPLRVVATALGHLDVFAGASQTALVHFGASGMLPPADPASTTSVELSRMCFELGLPSQFF